MEMAKIATTAKRKTNRFKFIIIIVLKFAMTVAALQFNSILFTLKAACVIIQNRRIKQSIYLSNAFYAKIQNKAARFISFGLSFLLG